MPITKPCPAGAPETLPYTEEQGGKPGVLIAFVVIAIVTSVLAGIWWYSGRNEKLRAILSMVIPDEYLPESVQTESLGYRTVSTNFGEDDLEEDAPEIELDDSTANV